MNIQYLRTIRGKQRQVPRVQNLGTSEGSFYKLAAVAIAVAFPPSLAPQGRPG